MSQWEDVPGSEQEDYWMDDFTFFVLCGCGILALFGLVFWWVL